MIRSDLTSCLLVEDDEDDFLLIESILSDIGSGSHEVEWASDYAQAAEKLAARHFDVCLVDYRIGAKTGLDFIREAISNGSHVPMILLTGLATRDLDLEASEVGAYDFLDKGDLTPSLVERSIRYAVAQAGHRRALEDQTALLKATLEHTGAGIAAFDAEMTLETFNQRLLEILGIEQAEPGPGPSEAALTSCGDGLDQAIIERLDELALDRTAQLEIRAPDNRIIEAQHNLAPDGRHVVICLDITERKQLEEHLRESQKMEAVGHLTGGVAHEFNNLLTAVIGSLEMMQDLMPEDEILQGLQRTAMRGASRGAELTQRLLAFSRRQALQPASTELHEMVAEAKEIIRRTVPETIAIDSQVPPGVWPVWVDVGQLENALLNLSINARDAMPDGGQITIGADNLTLTPDDLAGHPEVAPGDYVAVWVRDTGEGIPPEIMERVFEPFFTTKEVGQGTGLGLSIVYGFAEQSGGFAEINSTPGNGTTVSLFLPRAQQTESRTVAPTSTKQPKGNETILLVEDDGLVREATGTMLRGLGYEVVEVENGPRALEILDGGIELDLLFTDVVMPGGISGTMLAEQARQRRPELRVIVTSGYSDEVVQQDGFALYGVRLLSKPYTLQEMACTLREVLEAPADQPLLAAGGQGSGA